VLIVGEYSVRGGPTHSGITPLREVEVILFLSVHDGIHGWELWRTVGTEAGTVGLLEP